MQPPADATVLALDLGGTQVRAALVRADGTRLGRAAAPTPAVHPKAARAAAPILDKRGIYANFVWVAKIV